MTKLGAQKETAMTDSDLQSLIERAAEAGAARALERVGLHDEHAGKDIGDLRALLETWREAKKEAVRTATKWFITAIIGATALGAWLQWSPKQ